ncbi:hypothetical protein L0V05_12660 [Tabrizicola sp. J26]|uniref:hypothetical protein n=1 Tax=Alitabrizicola rongguiensis TaxID=2909234 RepID=UPI001F1B02AE|nr:hypothetical protein [Tabrizicola rongguiensis]MCF1709665.1 hypothetical protein [Tabrizicola rongguiensis]
MSDTSTTIAQLLYTKRPPMNFAHVVRELDAALLRCPADRRSLSWDCDDVAVFDLDAARIALGYADDLPGGYRACLSISVGHGPASSVTAPPLLRRRASLCRLILDRISGRYPADEVVWHEQEEVTTAETIDRLLDQLPAPEIAPPTAAEFDRLMARLDDELRARAPEHDSELVIEASVEPTGAEAPGFWSALLDTDIAQRAFAMARQKSEAAAAARSRRITVPELAEEAELETVEAVPAAAVSVTDQTVTVPAAVAANDRPDLPLPMIDELARLRAALYPEEPVTTAEETARPTTAMRLAVHAMNATLITVYAPVGAAVMTYSILKGEDMRLSGRMMALAGAFLALTNTPMAHQVMAAIGT